MSHTKVNADEIEIVNETGEATKRGTENIEAINKVEGTKSESDFEPIKESILNIEWLRGEEKVTEKAASRIKSLGIFQVGILCILLAVLWILNSL